MLVVLKNIGVVGVNLNWFKSYLQNRGCRVKIVNTYSEYKLSNCGVPQGSNLGGDIEDKVAVRPVPGHSDCTEISKVIAYLLGNNATICI
ncbi:hypothetical protein J6590_078732 [Homalodisca vitripennis]|nr:hypothetical protein J6590_078732 [Homalodisca vitripennis]